MATPPTGRWTSGGPTGYVVLLLVPILTLGVNAYTQERAADNAANNAIRTAAVQEAKEDRERVCASVVARAVKEALETPAAARQLLEEDPDGSSFVNEEEAEQCPLPGRFILRELDAASPKAPPETVSPP